MEELTLLQKFVDSELIRELSLGNKALATFYITITGMAITFFALTILWGCIVLLSIIFKPNRKKKLAKNAPNKPEIPEAAIPIQAAPDDGERIAVITAALAAALDTPLPLIRVKPIFKQDDPTPQWGKVGRIEQLIGN